MAVETRARADEDQAQAEFAETLESPFAAVLRATGLAVPGGDTELTLSQYNVMSALGDGAGTVSEIAAAAEVAVPTATRALRSLEQRGLVSRRRNRGEDGRVVSVSLTRTGERVLAEKRTWVRARQRAIFDRLSKAEQRTASGLLRVIAEDIHEL
jgi:MarR family transcriptional regulator, organic hydroperoxide resistance regulator